MTVGGGRGQPILLDLQPIVLVGVLDAGRGDLLDLVTKEVDLPGALAGIASQPLGLPGEPAQLAAGRVEGAEVDATEGIEGTALGLGVGERPVLVLAVQFDQPPGDLAQRPDGCHAAVDPRLGPATPHDRPGQDDLDVGLTPDPIPGLAVGAVDTSRRHSGSGALGGK